VDLFCLCGSGSKNVHRQDTSQFASCVVYFTCPFLCLAVVIARVHAMVAAIWSTPGQVREFVAVLGIRIRNRMFLSFPDPDPLVWVTIRVPPFSHNWCWGDWNNACKIKSYNACKIRSYQKILEQNFIFKSKTEDNVPCR
jgi:hypothetical protein